MLFKSIYDILSFEASDKTTLKEIIHPKNDGVRMSYSLAQASLKVGESSVPHYLVNQTELYYFLKGEGKIVIDGEQQKVSRGDVVLVPKGATQHIDNQGNSVLEFLCIVSPPWEEKDDIAL